MRETVVTVDDLIQPLFVSEGAGREKISSMPGIERLGLQPLAQHCKRLQALGIPPWRCSRRAAARALG